MDENLRSDDLHIKRLTLLQDPNVFCFGVDAVLLSDFAKIKKEKTVIDLGCGNGIIPVLLSAKTKAKSIIGLEIQENAAKLASKNVERNGLSGKVKIINGDIKNVSDLFPKASFDYVVSNPPYKKQGSGIINENTEKYIARHEAKCDLFDVIKSSEYLLAPLGKLFMIHRPERLYEIFCAFLKVGLEPKRMRFVCPKTDRPPSMVLIEAAKGEKPFLKIENNLYIQNEDSSYTDEINRIYNR